MLKSSLLELVLSTSGAKAGMPQIEPPELILSTSGAEAGKYSNQGSWSSFCRLLEPKPENAQIELPGAHFVDFWSQGQKMLKSSFLELILSTSGAKGRKC